MTTSKKQLLDGAEEIFERGTLSSKETSDEPAPGELFEHMDRHPMADVRVLTLLQQYQKAYPGVDLSQPVASAHGRDWYNLHLVLVSDHRWMVIRPGVLCTLRS